MPPRHALDSLPVSSRTRNALRRAGLQTVEDGVALIDERGLAEIAALRNMGALSTARLVWAIRRHYAEGEPAHADPLTALSVPPATIRRLDAAGFESVQDVQWFVATHRLESLFHVGLNKSDLRLVSSAVGQWV